MRKPIDDERMTSSQSHFLENILLFPRMLRQAGLPISPEQTLNFVQGAALVDIASREELYHTARSLLVTRKEQLRLFETLFNRFWRVHARGEWANEGNWQKQEQRRRRQR